MSAFTSKDLAAAARHIAAHVETCADRLNAADGRLGDGDLGVSMLNGWREIVGVADGFPEDVGLALLEAGKAFQRVAPSSFGTLMATALMSAAKACKGRQQVGYAEVPALLVGARDAMMARGKGELGAKTVLDTLDAMAAATEGLSTPAELLSAADKAAEGALAAFKDKPNRLGRARMFGEKSVGLDDPGMLAVHEILRGLG
jgi:phosphoenolpyruvate---glycerone phosphotransferase subunit DhaL